MALARAADFACIDFHGVPIELAYEPFPGDAYRALFAAFPRTGTWEQSIRIELTGGVCVRASQVPEGWAPSFCHGLIQGYSRGGEHILSDGRSRIDVSPARSSMCGSLQTAEAPEVAGGMQHIALSLLLRERGIFDLHAATACTSTRSYVVLGDSGSGKTTLLLSLIAIGCAFLGDDRLLFRASPGKVELLAYPREFHLTTSTARAFPELNPVEGSGSRIDGKFPVDPLRVWPQQFRPAWRGPISLLLPHVATQPETTLRAVNAAEAFGSLLASSAGVVVDGIAHRTEQLASLHALANASNAFDLALGTDLLADPRRAARRLLEALERGNGP